MNRMILTSMIALAFFVALPTPKASAFLDPVTMALLSPVALETATALMPFVETAVAGTVTGVVNIGAKTCKILYLPLGVLKSTLGAPFGLFGDGMVNIGQGLMAPFEVVYEVLVLPVRMVGGM